MISECVGRGEKFYEHVKANPDSAIGLDYRECFTYCIPSKNDYHWLDAHRFVTKLTVLFVQQGHYDPRNWKEYDPENADDILAAKCYDRLVDVVKRDTEDPFKLVVELSKDIDLETVYKTAYKHSYYGLGNLVKDIMDFVLPWAESSI